MSSGVVSIDGVLVEPGRATVSVFDRGFLYGDGVFEVLRTYGGEPFALEEHVARLRRSAERVFIEMPVDDATVRGEILAAVEAAREAGGSPVPPEVYVRVMVTRGTGPLSLDPDTATRPLRVVLVQPVRPPARELYLHGIALVSASVRRPADGTDAAGAKITNYLSALLAMREAKLSGAQEALMLDARGHVLEGASSNVFAVHGGQVVTPPESAGILAGITRARVLALARAAGRIVEVRDLPLGEVAAADEVFITSSVREVLPAVRLDGRAVGEGVPGPVSRALHRAFRGSVGQGHQPMPWE